MTPAKKVHLIRGLHTANLKGILARLPSIVGLSQSHDAFIMGRTQGNQSFGHFWKKLKVF
jgi:hypothetical protein